jgi:signal transduction histidine kinase/DNA-binding response OmpR family regulator
LYEHRVSSLYTLRYKKAASQRLILRSAAIFTFSVASAQGQGFFTTYTTDNGLALGEIACGLRDKTGNLWFGTYGGGVSRYDGESFTNFTTSQGLANNIVNCITEDKTGNLWFGTYGGGVSRYDGESFTNFTTSQGLASNIVWSIIEDKMGNLWFGTDRGGVSRYDGESFMNFSTKDGLPDDCITQIIFFQENIIIASNFGIAALINFIPKFHISNEKSKLSPQNNLNNSELNNHSPVFKIYNSATGYPVKDVNSGHNTMLLDSKGIIWVGTGSNKTALVRIDFNAIHKNDKPPTVILQSLKINNEKICWYNLKGMKNNASSPSKYSLGEEALNENNVELKQDSINNISKFNIHPSDSLELINEEVLAFGYTLDDDMRTAMYNKFRDIKFDGITRFYPLPENLILPYKHNNITFKFVAVEPARHNLVKYQYFLEGYDKDWSPVTNKTSAGFGNIYEGTYTFKLKACSPDGVWSEPISYTFKVLPPWWRTWWMYTIYIIVLFLLLRYYIRFSINREKIKSELDKTRELDKMKSRFFTNISHEFRTPLTLLLGPVEELLKKSGKFEADEQKLLKTMKRSGMRLKQLINQLLDLAKLESGKLKLKVFRGNITGHVNTIVQSFMSLAESKSINYEYNLEKSSEEVFYDTDKVEKIITNLISNALKFTPEGGSVFVSLQFSGNNNGQSDCFAEIEVKDTGPGIPDAEKEKIFDRFYQLDSNDSQLYEGSGIGLSLVKELVELHKGKIEVKSDPDGSRGGKGSTFIVKLPVSETYFVQDEMQVFLETPDVEVKTKVEESVAEKINEETNQLIPTNETDKDLPLILVVEDNKDLREYISRSVNHLHKVEESENGRLGFEKAIEIIPDLIISDIMMPEMDGTELCEKLKNDERTSHIPVILLTAKAGMENRLEGLETGADDYIIKPFEVKELQIRAKNLVEQRIKLREKFSKEYFINGEKPEMTSADDRFLQNAIDILDEHLDENDFSVEIFSKKLGVSQKQLYRKLQALTNNSPSLFIRKHRLKRSIPMLKNGYDHISQIAYMVGFNDPSYYSKCFRELFGASPGEYTRNNT